MTGQSERLQSALADVYVIERELGAGGMATVYLARDLKHDRPVAVKVLAPEVVASVGAERFLREIRVTARLSHPHLLPLYDSGEADGHLYYVMPFIEGESLAERLTREKQLPIKEAVQIAREVAEALAQAHSHGLVHRDIKPENIMLSGGHAVVADFGVAGAVLQAGGDRLTRTGTTVGTPAYMSPEQGLGADALDGRSDIYSLGCVLFEMLVGQVPFTGPTSLQVIARHSMDNVPPPSIMRDTIPKDLEEIVLRSMAKLPADRFATAAAMAEALAAVAVQRWRPRDVRFVSAGIEHLDPDHCAAQVELVGAVGSSLGRAAGGNARVEGLRTAAQAAAVALQELGHAVEVDGVELTRAFGEAVVAVRVTATREGDPHTLTGFCLAGDDPTKAAARAVLNATNRFLGIG